MATIPVSVQKRLKSEIPRFQKVLKSAVSRDINEADTVIIVTDILEGVFGLDKYEEVTREFVISGTYVDLAVITNKKIDYLIEVKAIGRTLKESDLRQAINYAAKEGVRWAVLTNGIEWQIHRVIVEGKVTNQNIINFNFLKINTRSNQDLETLFLLCKKGVSKDLIEEYYEQKQTYNRFTIGAILVSDDVLKVIKRLLKKVNPNLRIDDKELVEKLSEGVIKREILESDSGVNASKMLKKALTKHARQQAKKKQTSERDKFNNI